MPTSGLDYDKHGRPARVKPKAKDSDNRSITSGTSSRRHRDSSVSSNRTTLPPAPPEFPPQRSQSTSSNVSVDQLSSLPESGSGSPSSVSPPALRTISKASTSSAITTSSFHRTPAFLQPYLESESDLPGDAGDSQATPRAEKSREQCEAKIELPKIESPRPASLKTSAAPRDSEPPSLSNRRSSDATQTPAIRPSSRPGPSTTFRQETQYRDIYQPAPKRPASSAVSLEPGSPNSVAVYPYALDTTSHQPFYSPQLAYLPQPPTTDLAMTQQALVTQGALCYPEYMHPPPPAPDPPQQSRYASGPEDSLSNENPMALLNRVHYAMPDLHRLLESYQEMCSILESRELQIRDMDAHRAAEQQQQRNRFAKMEEEIQSLLKCHSAEITRFELEIGKVGKSCKDLHDKLTEEQRANDRLEAAVQNSRTDRKEMGKKHDEEKTVMAQKFSHDKDRMAAEYRSKQKSLHEESQAQVRKAEATLSEKEAFFNRSHEEDRQKLETAWAKEKREIDDRHVKTKISLEDKLETRQKVIDEERRTYLQAREGWDRERETMTRRWDEERDILRRASEEQCKALTARYEREKNDILKHFSQTQQRTEKEEGISKLQREIEILRAGWEADKFKFQRTTAEFRSTARTLNDQNVKLQRLTEAFGDTADVKGR